MHVKQQVSVSKIRKDAEDSYRNGFFCCEAVMDAIRSNFELDVPEEVIAMSSGMSVGAGRSGCMCGALNGGILALGMFFGRTVPKGAHGSAKLDNPTNLGSILISATTELFEKIADKTLTVRRITIAANRVIKDEGFFQVDLFTDTTKLEKEKKLQNAMLGLKKKFGKNAVLKGTNYLDGATMRERNQQIGGHKAK